MSDKNVQTVKDAYAAFGRGDVPSILALLDDNIQWEPVKGTEGAVPHAGTRRGKAAVGEFFSILASGTEFHRFEPREFIDGGDTVVVIGEYDATAKSTGRRAASQWVMVFDLANGKVTRFREWTDSAALVRAYGTLTTA